MAKKWMEKLQSLSGAVVEKRNPFARTIMTPSPSVNFCFGKTWGLPEGLTVALYGPPKGGKSVILNSMIGQLHQDDPEAIAVKINTEFREEQQLTDEDKRVWKIDESRYQAIENNSAVGVFDMVEGEIGKMCEEGAPIRLVAIDSLNSLVGRRMKEAKSLASLNWGDHALTIQEGLKRILPVQRKYRIALVLTCHVRAEMDQVEQMRGNKTRMAAAFGVQHHAEYFLYVEPNRTAKARASLQGAVFVDEALGDVRGAKDGAEKTAHKIRVSMKDSSIPGSKGRVGEFTLDYEKGIINVYEEVYLLAEARGVIERPTQNTYTFGERKWVGRDAVLDALREDQDLQAAMILALRKIDLAPGPG